MGEPISVTVTVLPGHRVEIVDPQLLVGDRVRVVLIPEPPSHRDEHYMPMLDLVATLPPGPRSAPTWEELERRLQEERDAWDE